MRIPLRRSRMMNVGAIVAALLLAAIFCVPFESGATNAAPGEPCDIYAGAGTACVAAFSSTRALFSSYDGPLYQVQRASDNATKNIGLLATGGYANAKTQDEFCAGTECTVTVIYDQTPRHNDLSIEGPGAAGGQDKGADAAALPITVAGHKAYGIYLPPGTGYRRSSTETIGTARNGQPESMYEVASGTNANHDCCSDFGNVETKEEDTGQGHMDALNISYLNAAKSVGNGPWVEGDLENGVFQGHTGTNPYNVGNPGKFVTAVLKNNGQDRFALKGGDAQRGRLSTWYEGPEPVGDYTPMKQEGSIVLGTGGDNSNRGTGSFFEGVMTAGYSTDAVDNAVQANIAAQHYQGVSTGGGPGQPIVGPGDTCVGVVGDDDGGAGRPVELETCRKLAADQHWLASDFGAGTLGTLGRCMSASQAKIVLADCSNSAAEIWLPQPDGTIENPGYGRCLDTTGGRHPRLRLSGCTGTRSQQFAVSSPLYHAGKCIDAAGNNVGANGAVIQLWDCQTIINHAPRAEDEQWSYHPADQTISTLGRCLTLDDNATANGTQLELHDCVGLAGQEWVPQSNDTIKNPQSGRCLETPNGSTTNGTPVQLHDCDVTRAQAFRFN